MQRLFDDLQQIGEDGRNIYDVFHKVEEQVAATPVPIKIDTLAGKKKIICYQTCEMSSTLYKNFILKKCPQLGRCMVLDKSDFTIQYAYSTKKATS